MARRIPTIEVPKTANIPPGNITPTEWIEAKSQVEVAYTETTVQAALRFDPEHPMYGAQRGDANEPSSIVKSANRAAIQQAADDARDTGGTLVLKGEYWIDDTIQIECHVDGASGTLRINNTNINPAVIVGRSGSNLSARHIVLPAIRQMGRTVGTGWGGNDVGLRVNRLNQSNLWITLVANFSSNVEMYAENGGTSYNNIYLGMIHNGKIGLDFQTAPTSGWVNENLFFGGRFVIDTAEGTNIAGCRHMRVPVAPSGHFFNNNVFIKPSIEGSAPEYHVETGGSFNHIIDGRWEVLGGSAKLLWANDAHSWVIEGGYNLHTVEFHTAPGNSAVNCRVVNRGSEYWRSSGSNATLRYANSSSDASPVLWVLPGGSTFWTRDHAADYYVSIAGTETIYKGVSDSAPRFRITSTTGRLAWGDGSSAPDVELYRSSADTLRLGAGDDLYLDGLWNGSRLRLRNAYLWVDASGNLRKKTSAPTSDTDGDIIG